MRAYVVVDLGFGDCGKGLVTDFLARQLKVGLVVRYNGGAQAGHNVTAPDGRQHTFSQFGSGTFVPGVKTFLSKKVVIHPGALLVEGDILQGKGVSDPFSRLRVSDQALVITPFHQAANHIREMGRGENRHGSCGVGVGEAVEDALAYPQDRVLAGDLSNPAGLRRKLEAIRERKRDQLAESFHGQLQSGPLAREWQTFERKDLIDTWTASIARIGDLGLVAPDELLQGWLRQEESVIFEGAQGVLLDEDAGFHPFTTWSACTGSNAHILIQEMAPDAQVFQIGVMRSYAVRHGPGPLPTETDDLVSAVSEHNQFNQWQGRVRYGWFDAVLARYALSLTGKIDSLVVTHLDVLPHLQTWRYCPGYAGTLEVEKLLADPPAAGEVLENIRLPGFLTLAQREQFTRALFKVTPILEACKAEEGPVIQKLESILGLPVGIVSLGPHAEDVKLLNPFPA